MILKSKNKNTEFLIAITPIVFLIFMLWFNVGRVFGADALDGSNQFVLVLAGAVAIALGILRGVKFEVFTDAIAQNLKDTTKPLIIILLIGALAGTWFISGVVPAMIYYGLQVLSAQYFLAASLIICALVSLATGSSWGTTATVGIALIGMARAMGINEGMAAGAIISGAYFGDKMSPLSDTTNLAPAMAGGELFGHIKYMMLTTIPSIILALIIFFILGFTIDTDAKTLDTATILASIESSFHISPWLFLVPGLVIFLIVKKVDALIAIFLGAVLGGIFAIIFQPQIIAQLSETSAGIIAQNYEAVMRAIYGSVSIPSENAMLAELFSSKGISGMLNTVWLIVAAMIFGGAIEAAGFLEILMRAIKKLATSTFSLVASTVGSCVVLNVTASDQYLAIVVPGRMFKDLYAKQNLAPENLSRTLEDSGTVTSVLIPWNTCGAYQSGVLGVATGAYFFYAFFNLISPIMTLLFAFFHIKIKKLSPLSIADKTVLQ